jgi:hypothetical protein
MTLGAIPVVTDTVGTSVYVTDDVYGIVLRGVRDTIWHTDPSTGILVDRYFRNPRLDDSLVSQLTSRILTLLGAPDTYQQMRSRTMAHARETFSGQAFSNHFWSAVTDLYQNHHQPSAINTHLASKVACSLRDCTVQGDDWARVFESPTQPVRKIYTGQSIVWELGGAVMHAYGNPSMELNDWSVLAQHYSPGALQTTFAYTVDELGGKHFSFVGESGKNTNSKLIGFVSRVLMPFPSIHSYAASMHTKLRRYHRYATSMHTKLRRYHRFLAYRFNKSNAEPDIELMLHGVFGYNVIRYFHKCYAIPQNEGEFILDKAKVGGYSSSFSGSSVDQVIRKIVSSIRPPMQPALDNVVTVQPELVLEGFHGFNIIRLGDEFYAILQCEGAFDRDRLLSRGYSRSFSGDSLAEVQSVIMASTVSEQWLAANHATSSSRSTGD